MDSFPQGAAARMPGTTASCARNPCYLAGALTPARRAAAPLLTLPQDAVDRGWLCTEPSYTAGTPDEVSVLLTAREIASAMAFLHASNIVHGDLSAFNVLLTSAAPRGLDTRGFHAKVSGGARGQTRGPGP